MAGIRVLVADNSQADLYELPTRRSALKPVRSLVNPEGHKTERALGTSRPGRVANRAAGVRQAYEPKHGLKEHAEEVFVRRVVGALSKDPETRRGAPVVLVAAPKLLGLYRRHLPAAIRECVVLEIRRDLVRLTPAELTERVRAAVMELPPSAIARRRTPGSKA